MGDLGRGRVEHGTIVFDEPLALPDGTRVVVRIEEEAAEPIGEAEAPAKFTSLPFFGMWADRDDLPESVEMVREGRERWHHRGSRPD